MIRLYSCVQLVGCTNSSLLLLWSDSSDSLGSPYDRNCPTSRTPTIDCMNTTKCINVCKKDSKCIIFYKVTWKIPNLKALWAYVLEELFVIPH